MMFVVACGRGIVMFSDLAMQDDRSVDPHPRSNADSCITDISGVMKKDDEGQVEPYSRVNSFVEVQHGLADDIPQEEMVLERSTRNPEAMLSTVAAGMIGEILNVS